MNVTAEVVSSTVISVGWDYLKACSQVYNDSSQVDNDSIKVDNDSSQVDNDMSVNFTVQYTKRSSDERGDINLTGQLIVTTTNAQITELLPYTNYSIKVAVVNDIGDIGPYSFPDIVETGEYGKNSIMYGV